MAARFSDSLTPLNQAVKDPKMVHYNLVPQRQNASVAPDEIMVRVTAVDINAVDFMTSTQKPKVLTSSGPTLTAAKGLGKGNSLSLN
mmetsp:Transcript_33898/g.76760  ORF Transcript_33898/g.76760 Transcript_33898/m.76760 type:complete len:87 (-) Transcript_33898:91-351(-)